MNRVESELVNELLVLRVNIQSPAGEEVSKLYASRTTPTFIMFDPQGEEIWRSIGNLDPEKVRASLEEFH